MAEAIAAVGLASAVVQFVDFASTIISKGNKYRKSTNGILPEHEGFRMSATRLRDLTKGLDDSLSACKLQATLSREESALQSVVQDCQNISIDLERALERLQWKGHMTIWKSSRQAFKSVWTKDEIDKKVQALRDAQNQALFHLVVVLSGRGSEERFQTLIETNNANQEAILKAIRETSSHTGEDIQRLSSIIEATQKGAASTPPSSRSQGGIKALIRRDPSGPQKLGHAREPTESELILLNSLLFPKITERYDSIIKANLGTFRWIFDMQVMNFPGCHDIVEWLRNPEEPPIYWISGKPGSGKSTLMRYLSDDKQNDNQTWKHLQAWARHRRLLTARCFFWAAGTSMQKSVEGLLQSLLYELCDKDPDQIAKLPRLGGQHPPNSTHEFDHWAHWELKTALEVIIESTTDTHAICLFVDGLDEFDGGESKREDLVRFFQGLSKFPNVKMCLSSRPWLVFQDAFEHGPTLRLEDLTREDIRSYVRSELQENSRFLQLETSDPNECYTVVSEITTKANGVFLWVVLVVRSLLEGLRNEDQCKDLLRRLAMIPSDLEEYFHVIIDSIEPFYFSQSCQVFRMVMEDRIDLSLPTLVFADDPELLGSAISAQEMSADLMAKKLVSMKRRLNVLCKGLLEVHERTSHNTMTRFTVDYLHRTVHDFLWLPKMKDKIDNGAPKNFSAHKALAQAHLVQIMLLDKEAAIKTGFNVDANIGDLIQLTDIVLGHAAAAELITQDSSSEQLQALGETLDSISSAANWEELTTSHVEFPYGLRYCGAEFWMNWMLWENTFLSLIISAGLSIHGTKLLQLQPDSIHTKRGRPLLDYALRQPLGRGHPWRRPPVVDLVRIMLEQGADPNQRFGQTTVWGLFLEALQRNSRPISIEWLQATELLIEYGAVKHAEVAHADMIPSRRIEGNGSLAADIDNSDTGENCLSGKSTIDAEKSFTVFGAQEAERLILLLRQRTKGDNEPSTEAPVTGIYNYVSGQLPTWRKGVMRLFRGKDHLDRSRIA